MSLIITRNFKRAKAQDAAADANFKKGDKVLVKTAWAGKRKGVVKEVINDPALKKAYVVEIEGAETAAYPAEIVSADAKDSIADKEREYTRLYELAQKNITFYAAKGDSAKVAEWKRKADEYKRLAQEAENAAETRNAKDSIGADAKFRLGQEVIVKTKYADPYRARIVGLWDMSQNGPYDEQGYLVKNIKGGGVESMPEHALSLATAKDSAEPNNDASHFST